MSHAGAVSDCSHSFGSRAGRRNSQRRRAARGGCGRSAGPQAVAAPLPHGRGPVRGGRQRAPGPVLREIPPPRAPLGGEGLCEQCSRRSGGRRSGGRRSGRARRSRARAPVRCAPAAAQTLSTRAAARRQARRPSACPCLLAALCRSRSWSASGPAAHRHAPSSPPRAYPPQSRSPRSPAPHSHAPRPKLSPTQVLPAKWRRRLALPPLLLLTPALAALRCVLPPSESYRP
jgi:hypothetical protein